MSEARKAERGEVLREGVFASPPTRGAGEHCKLLSGVRHGPGRFRTFYAHKAAPGVEFGDIKFI